MSTKTLSELRGEVQRDSTTFQEANATNTATVSVASNATTVLPGRAGSHNLVITGTADVTTCTVEADQTYLVRFDNVCTLVNSAAIITHTGGDLVTTPGASCILRATAQNVVEVLCYTEPTKSELLFSGSATSVQLPVGHPVVGALYSVSSGTRQGTVLWDGTSSSLTFYSGYNSADYYQISSTGLVTKGAGETTIAAIMVKY